MLNSLKNNEDINLYDDGNAIRDYMSVEDCCRAINLIIEKSNVDEIYNISNQNPVKIKDIIFYAKNKINSNSKINFIETPKFRKIVQVENMFLDNSKLLSYGYTPKKTIYEVIDQLLEA